MLLGCSKSPIDPIDGSALVVIIQGSDGSKTIRISQEELNRLPTITKQLKFEANGEEKKTKAVYLSDVLETIETGSDFWIVNCGDKYQSNFTLADIQSARPYLVLEVEDQPLMDWLKTIGHPEWGPNIINIENTDGFLDPGHKNPWGVTEIIATNRKTALAGWADKSYTESAERGLELLLNSCASCHQSGNGLLGGGVSTRPLALVSIFAASNETYFRALLKDPAKTNPLAQKMPSYAHWSEENVKDLIEFLKVK